MFVVWLVVWVVATVFIIGPIGTTIHEYGHFRTCRRLNIPVKEVRVGGWPRWRWCIRGVPWYFGFPRLSRKGRSGVTEPEWPSDRTLWVEMFASGPRMSRYAAIICWLATILVPTYLFPWAASLYLVNTMMWIGNYSYAGDKEPADGLGILLAQADPTFVSPTSGAPPIVDPSSAVYQAATKSVGQGPRAFGFYALMVFGLGIVPGLFRFVLAYKAFF